MEITIEKFVKMTEALIFVIGHPRAASGRGDEEHRDWLEMHRLAQEALK